MGWDYYTYQSQPTFFVNAIKEQMLAEQNERIKQLKEAQNQVNYHGR